MWSDAAAAVGNHLWQSTLFALMAGLLTLMLSKHPARLRYWLWLVASAKFLIPFSLLVAVGDRLAWLRGPAAADSGLYLAIEEIRVISRATSGAGFAGLMHLLPMLLAVWFCGFVVVLSLWCVRWRKIRSALRDATPLREGREVETLRRMERVAGVRKTELVLSRASLEPGVFGIARPVLIWPEGISAHLGDAQLDAVVAHEVWHVRRRDNLAAAMHMAVEAIFWFHPLVWWLGARLVEERERACDEQVLQSGSERQVYAESILKVCEFCLASPLACMSGVAGADLKKRMVNIMTHRALRKLDFTRKLLLGAAAVAAVGAPIVFGLVNATPGRASTQNEASAQKPEPVRVPPKEMQELIRKETKVPPQYPEAAKKAHLQGKVVLEAIISKDGDVENLQTVSGDAALVAASIDAVKQWKYKPYLVNGDPVEVKTQVTVNFTLAD
jgi:bla regulator protein blaR1